MKHMEENKMIDTQTGIGNLTYFEHYFNNMIPDSKRDLYYVAYIIFHSNYFQVYRCDSIFKNIVKYTAKVLRTYAKHNGFVARISENSFAFIFESTDTDKARQVITEIIDKLNLYVQEEVENTKPFFYVALYNLNHMDRSCELLLFSLRKHCGNIMGADIQLVYCDARMMECATDEIQLLENISNGLKNQEFKLYLQFVVENKTKKILSVEALSRWDNPDKGIITPGKYIKAMTTSGLITRFDYYMFEMVCRQLHIWRNTEFGALTVSCNFTRITLSEDDFVERIKDISSKYVFESSQLIIEITEQSTEKSTNNVLHNIQECKKIGFRIALDDIGCGYNSLINLCEYPIDIIKIDRNMLLKTDNKSGRDLFAGIVALAHSLNLKVVCEGVENKEQNEFVAASECDLIQGWYYSREFPPSEGEKFVRQYTRRAMLLN